MKYTEQLIHKPKVHAFFDDATNTISYVVADPKTNVCAVVDSVLDYEPHSATYSFEQADKLIACIEEHEYTLEWILETHVHADHLSAAPYIQKKLGGKLAIGKHIITVQQVFGKVFNAGTEFQRDGSQFDRLFDDGDAFMIGDIPVQVVHTPGHTPADVSYVIGDAVFVGDTLFMPDYGSARVDFPGGSAEDLYHSVQKLYALPDEMRMFLCHDYLPEGRDQYQWETTVGEQKRNNIQLSEQADIESFSDWRKKRDAQLGMPKLIIPSIQTNMRAGEFPPADKDGNVYLQVPVNSVFSKKKQ